MAEVTSGKNLTVIVLDEEEATSLAKLLNVQKTMLTYYPALHELAEAMGDPR